MTWFTKTCAILVGGVRMQKKTPGTASFFFGQKSKPNRALGQKAETGQEKLYDFFDLSARKPGPEFVFFFLLSVMRQTRGRPWSAGQI